MDNAFSCLTDHVALLARTCNIPELENCNIRMTELASKLSNIILQDSVHLHMKECEKYNKNKKDKHNQMIPYITPKSTDEVISKIKGYSFDQEIIVAEGIKATFISNGHLPGSASILFEIRENEYEKQTVLFSGDTSGTKSIPFTKPLDIKGKKINHIISEATYSDKLVGKNTCEKDLEKYIKETCLEKKGRICVPVFSVGRSTNVLYHLRRVYERNPEFNNIKIFFCSPMACKSHKIICDKSNKEFYDEKWHKELDIIEWEQVEYVESFKQLQKAIAYTEPCIYLASAGMVNAYSEYIIGRLINLSKNRVIFAGYQAEGTQGDMLLQGIQKSMTIEDAEGKKTRVSIRSDISKMNGLSGHGDYIELCKIWSSVEKKKLKNILLNHGNPESIPFLKAELEKILPSVNIKIPKYNEVVKLV